MHQLCSIPIQPGDRALRIAFLRPNGEMGSCCVWHTRRAKCDLVAPLHKQLDEYIGKAYNGYIKPNKLVIHPKRLWVIRRIARRNGDHKSDSRYLSKPEVSIAKSRRPNGHYCRNK